MPLQHGAYVLHSIPSEDGSTLLEALANGAPVASARLQHDPNNVQGTALERLYVDPAHRGKGLARALLQTAKSTSTGPLFIKPRPFNDMPVGIDVLKKLYTSEGFVPVDDKDTMVYTKPLLGKKPEESVEKTAMCAAFFDEFVRTSARFM